MDGGGLQSEVTLEAPRVTQVSGDGYLPSSDWRRGPGKEVDCFEGYLGNEIDEA